MTEDEIIKDKLYNYLNGMERVENAVTDMTSAAYVSLLVIVLCILGWMGWTAFQRKRHELKEQKKTL